MSEDRRHGYVIKKDSSAKFEEGSGEITKKFREDMLERIKILESKLKYQADDIKTLKGKLDLRNRKNEVSNE